MDNFRKCQARGRGGSFGATGIVAASGTQRQHVPSLPPACGAHLIHVRAGDAIARVALRAGPTLEAIPGVGAAYASEARVGVAVAWCTCRRSRGGGGHQGVGGRGLETQRTWKAHHSLRVHPSPGKWAGHATKHGGPTPLPSSLPAWRLPQAWHSAMVLRKSDVSLTWAQGAERKTEGAPLCSTPAQDTPTVGLQ